MPGLVHFCCVVVAPHHGAHCGTADGLVISKHAPAIPVDLHAGALSACCCAVPRSPQRCIQRRTPDTTCVSSKPTL